MFDSGLTCHLNKPDNKIVIATTGETSSMTNTALLLMTQLQKEACKIHILPALKNNSLMSVKVLADHGYTTIFHLYQKGVTIHDQGCVKITVTKKALLQGWGNKQGLWRVPLVDRVTDLATQKVM